MGIGKKILLVNNNASDRRALYNILWEGYDINEAENAREAMDYLTAGPKSYHLIITGLTMPVTDGNELLTAIKNTNALRNIPVLVVASAEEKEKQDQALELGAVDVIPKPFDEKVTARRVHNIFEMNVDPGYKNVMEEIVRKGIAECRDSLGICTCNSCMMDLFTLTLNRMKPKYVNTEKGELMSKINQLSSNSKIEVLSTIAIAAEIVKKNPRH